jgi:predicted transcriptional regulator
MNLTPLKTDKEKLVFRIIWKLSEHANCYVLIDSIQERIDLPKRSLSGIVASLQEKGWVYCFRQEKAGLDVEVTCMAVCEMVGTSGRRFCNHPKCFC